MPPASLQLFFENPVGQVLAQSLPVGGFVIIKHNAGPRRFADVQTLLGQAKLLLAKREWHKMLGDHRLMVPFTTEEETWITELWLNTSQPRRHPLFGAVLLPAEDFAQLPSEVAAATAQAAAMTYRLFGDHDLARAWLEEMA
ncbi:hypothetical protein [Hymenobacter glacialis]|uniref:hypothetical protein n=1 Tax=Hymenobacter glacialis TaxID=1908236 RepID=UPI000F775A98|nr:hypothetical protein [Hymenobacter glacialis]